MLKIKDFIGWTKYDPKYVKGHENRLGFSFSLKFSPLAYTLTL